MKLNSLLFPAPESSYDSENLYKELLYIPRRPLSKHSGTVAPSAAAPDIEEEKFQKKPIIGASISNVLEAPSEQPSDSPHDYKAHDGIEPAPPSPDVSIPAEEPTTSGKPLPHSPGFSKSKKSKKSAKSSGYIPCLFLPY